MEILVCTGISQDVLLWPALVMVTMNLIQMTNGPLHFARDILLYLLLFLFILCAYYIDTTSQTLLHCTG